VIRNLFTLFFLIYKVSFRFRSLDHIAGLLREARRVLQPTGSLLLIDHFDSFYLRAIFRLLQIRCPLYPAAVRHFGNQLREEREIVAWWLDN
jgi:ubiquinone/menaquinone biosynthesis C-methylase UbiE